MHRSSDAIGNISAALDQSPDGANQSGKVARYYYPVPLWPSISADEAAVWAHRNLLAKKP
jgi:hypothetical protein